MRVFSNKVVLGLLSVGLLMANTAYAAPKEDSSKKEATDNWETFTSEKNGFSIDFPAKPEHVSQTIDIPKTDMVIQYDTFISEPNENSIYVVSVWEYPESLDLSEPYQDLETGFQGMISALPGSEVVKKDKVDVAGNDALEFIVKNDEIFFQGKLLVVDNTLYQIFVVYKEDDKEMDSNYKRFIESFELLKKQTPPQVKTQKMKI